MIVGERGQITIPKALRERYGFAPNSEVELVEVRGEVVLRRRVSQPRDNPFHRWRGALAESVSNVDDLETAADSPPPCSADLAEGVDAFIEAIRGE